MSDLAADMNQINERKSRQSIFDSSKFWGHKKSLNKDTEISPAMTIKDESLEQLPEIIEKEDSIEHHPKVTVINDSIEQIPENNRELSKPDDVKLYESISGNFIISKGWDGTNMSVYKIRRKYL
ncbi:hypothetical protein [Neobacillus vireti]|uniref:hypothetical protein n=1 Tax=Neobacillus vireti TaxID=220686 RepID=UPI002FFE0D8A